MEGKRMAASDHENSDRREVSMVMVRLKWWL